MNIIFLGTSAAIPTTERNTSAVFVKRLSERFLFDCGEGTQRQMMRFRTGFGVSHIFLTHLHGDHVLGLPGLCQTWNSNKRTKPLTIHTPPETKSAVEELIGIGGIDPDYPISIYEVSPGTVAVQGSDYEIRAFRTDHRTQSVGYVLVEDERRGRFDREKAETLGVPVGPKFGQLQRGKSIKLEDGAVVHPSQVLGPSRPGRRLVYTGDTRPTDVTVSVARDADLLIHDATFTDNNIDRARRTGHSTAKEAAQIASRVGVKRLALMHLSARYNDGEARLEHQAREIFDGEAFVPSDGLNMNILYQDR